MKSISKQGASRIWMAIACLALSGCALEASGDDDGDDAEQGIDTTEEALSKVDECSPNNAPDLLGRAVAEYGVLTLAFYNEGNLMVVNNKNDAKVWVKAPDGTVEETFSTSDNLHLNKEYAVTPLRKKRTYVVEFHFDRPNKADPKCKAIVKS